jgi:hypothetical protein
MGIDRKYGRVTLERGTVGADEPVVVFRGQDKLLTHVLDAYWALCLVAGSPQRHLDVIHEARNAIVAWQAGHPTKTPESLPAYPPA